VKARTPASLNSKSLFDHLGWFQSKQDVDPLVGLAAEQRAGQHESSLSTSGKGAQCIPLRRWDHQGLRSVWHS
jgi:hypothetical protein